MPIPIPRPRESGRQLTKGRYCVAIFSMIFMTQIEQINVIVNGLLIDGQQISRNEYLTGGFVTRNSVTRTQHLTICTNGKSYYEIPESFPQLKMRKTFHLMGWEKICLYLLICCLFKHFLQTRALVFQLRSFLDFFFKLMMWSDSVCLRACFC